MYIYLRTLRKFHIDFWGIIEGTRKLVKLSSNFRYCNSVCILSQSILLFSLEVKWHALYTNFDITFSENNIFSVPRCLACAYKTYMEQRSGNTNDKPESVTNENNSQNVNIISEFHFPKRESTFCKQSPSSNPPPHKKTMRQRVKSPYSKPSKLLDYLLAWSSAGPSAHSYAVAMS